MKTTIMREDVASLLRLIGVALAPTACGRSARAAEYVYIGKAGADLASLAEGIDTSSATGRFMLTVLAALATLERDLAAECTTAATRHKPAEGGSWNPETLDAPDAVAELLKLRADGLPLRATAAARTCEAPESGSWSPETVRWIERSVA